MAVGRIIRKTIFNNHNLNDLDNFEKLLYTWLVVSADREGRIDADPITIASTTARYLQCDDADIAVALAALGETDLLVIYEDQAGRYIQFNNFKESQNMITKDGSPTTLYGREIESQYPSPQFCKIIAGQMYCQEDAEKMPRNLQEDAKKPETDFIDQLKANGHSPDSYKCMNANEVLTFIFGWLKKNGKDVMLPAGSTDWDKISGRIRGIAGYIGQIVTPIRLPMILSYIRDQKGFIYGPCSPFVLKLVKQWNKDNLEVVEGL